MILLSLGEVVGDVSAVLSLLDASLLDILRGAESASSEKGTRLELHVLLQNVLHLTEPGHVPFGLEQLVDTGVPHVDLDFVRLGHLASEHCLYDDLMASSLVLGPLCESVLRP